MNSHRGYRAFARRLGWSFAFPAAVAPFWPGCNAIRNGWLDPTVVGAFDRNRVTEIRTALTLEDTPSGIPGAEYPAPIDHVLIEEEYAISSGDTLAIEIDELRQRDTVFQSQAMVSSTGFVNLPILGRMYAAGLTVPDFEKALVEALRDSSILVEPSVVVNPLFLHNSTYSIFGVGVSAANNAPLRAGTFPIRYPSLRLLEAINLVGGLNEFVTDIYLFRTYEPPADFASPATGTRPTFEVPRVAGDEPAKPCVREDRPPLTDTPPVIETRPAPSPEQELYDAVTGEDPPDMVEKAFARNERDRAIPEDLEPDPTQPFLWDNAVGEFVPNPAYQAPQPEPVPSRAEPLPLTETVTPAVNWSRLAGDTAYRIIRIPAEALRSGDPEVNIFIRPADVIRIVSGEIGVYYVMGQVNRVGAFAFNAETITLKAAIAASGGLSGLAWPDRCTVYRRFGQREQMIQVNLDRIFAGKDPDFVIRRGDIVNVGTHPFAPFLQRIRAFTLPNPTTNVGYGFTYARNFADVDSFGVKRNPANEEDNFPNLFP